MTQVNLLPPEIRQRAIVRRNTILVGLVGALLLGIMVLLYLGESSKLSQVNDDVAAQEQTNASLQQQAAGLAKYAALKSQAEAKGLVLKGVYVNEVSMSSLLQDISNVMPSDGFLTSIAVTIAAPGAEVVTADGTSPFVGQVTFAGNVYRLDTFPLWLDRIGGIKGFENAYLNSYTESPAGSLLYGFQSGADLTQEALTDRGVKAVTPPAVPGAPVVPGAAG